MLPSFNMPLVPGQIAAFAGYFREHPEVAHLYGLRVADADEPVGGSTNDPLDKRYHLAPTATPGLPYDDRLPVRLGCSADKAYEYVNLPPANGGLRCKRLGKRIVVTEQAVREFLGDKTAA